MNVKVGWMLVKSNGVSMIGENCKKSPMNTILSPPNYNIFYYNFYDFKCIVTIIVQPTIDISSTIMNWMLHQLSSIILFIIIFLTIDKPSKEWIIVPPINKVEFAMYVVMRNLSSLFVFKKYSRITLMIYVLPIPIATHMF